MPLNPLDWTAGPFLTLYVVMFALAWLAVRWMRRQIGDTRPGDYPGTPGTLDLAWLAGGRDRAAETVLVGFLSSGAATSGAGGTMLTIDNGEAPLPTEFQPFRVAVSTATNRPAFLRAVGPGLEAVRDRLIRHGLIPNTAEIAALTRATWLTLGIPMGLGCLKVAVGLSRDRPVGILVVLIVATLATVFWLLRAPPVRTRAGTAVWQTCRKRFARAARAPDGPEMALAFALSGAAILAGTAYAPVMARGSGGGSSSCSSGGDSGGGGGDSGGGGCGGCGGGSD